MVKHAPVIHTKLGRAYFYSVRATGGGQHAVHRLKRRAGTTADVKQAT